MAKRWQQLVNTALASVYPALEAMSDSELRNVRSAPKKMTNTNCWWLAQAWAPELGGIADGLLKFRARQRREDKKQARLKTPNVQIDLETTR